MVNLLFASLLVFEPEVGGALIAFDHDCTQGCDESGSHSGGELGIGARYAVAEPGGLSIRGRFDLTTAGRQYMFSIGGYWQFLPAAYAELTLGWGVAGQYDGADIEARGWLASLRFARELAPWLSVAVQASTFIDHDDTNTIYSLRTYEASVALVLPIPLE